MVEIRERPTFSAGVQFTEGSSPGTPGAGLVLDYARDKIRWQKDSDGVEKPLTTQNPGRPKADDGTRSLILPGFIGSILLSTYAPGKDALLYETFILHDEAVLAGIYAEVVTASTTGGSKMRMGVWKADLDNQPGAAVILPASELAIDSTGVRSYTGLSTTLLPGLYLKGLTHNGTNAPQFRALRGAMIGGSMVGSALGSTIWWSNMFVARTYAALPDPGTKWTGATSAGNPTPQAIFLDLSSVA